jgi:hypothetical protein
MCQGWRKRRRARLSKHHPHNERGDCVGVSSCLGCRHELSTSKKTAIPFVRGACSCPVLVQPMAQRQRRLGATVATVMVVLHTLAAVAHATATARETPVMDPFEHAEPVGLGAAPTHSFMPPLTGSASPPFNTGGGMAGLYQGGSPPFNTTWYVAAVRVPTSLPFLAAALQHANRVQLAGFRFVSAQNGVGNAGSQQAPNTTSGKTPTSSSGSPNTHKSSSRNSRP